MTGMPAPLDVEIADRRTAAVDAALAALRAARRHVPRAPDAGRSAGGAMREPSSQLLRVDLQQCSAVGHSR